MAEIHTLILKSDSTGIKQSSHDLDGLSNSAEKAEGKTKNLDNTSKKTNATMGELKGTIQAVVAALAIKEIVQYADTWNLVNSRLKLVSDSTTEYLKAQKELFDIAQESRSGYEETADLFSRMSRATKNLSYDQDELLTVTEAVNKSLIISGASAGEASSATIQLGQALASGVLRGDEFNSIAENGSRISEALAASLGKTRGELRQMAEDGKLTADVVVKALLDQSSVIDGEFSKMNVTVAQSLTVADNTLMKIIGRFDEVSGVTASTSQTIIDLSNFIGENTDTIAEFGADIVRTFKVAGIGLAQIVTYHQLSWLKLEYAFQSTTEDILNSVLSMIAQAQNELAGSFLGETLGIEKTVFHKISLGAKASKVEIDSLSNSIMKMGIESSLLMADIKNDTTKVIKSTISNGGGDGNKGGSGAGGGGAGGGGSSTSASKAVEDAFQKELDEYDKRQEKLREQAQTLIDSLYPTDALTEKWEEQQALIAELENQGLINGQQRKDAMVQAEDDYQKKLTEIWKSGQGQREAFAAMSSKTQTDIVLGEMIRMTQGMATQNKVMFTINKVAALAQAAIDLPAGISKTMAAYPYPINIGMAALHTAAAVAQISAIASASYGGGNSVAPSQVGTGATTTVAQTSPQVVPVAAQSPQQVTIQLGSDDMVISTSSLRKLIEQINDTAGDMGVTLRIV